MKLTFETGAVERMWKKESCWWVWPDVGEKVAQLFPKVTQEVAIAALT